MLAVTAVVALVVGVLAVMSANRGDGRPIPAASGSVSTNADAPLVFATGQAALWPFTSLRGEEDWVTAYQASFADAWHLDADTTSLRFSTDYLGFANIATVTSRTTDGAHLRIGVGYAAPGNPTVAVVDLMRLSSTSAWEVVGASSPALSITAPPAGVMVGTSVDVDGRVTGAGASITVTVRQGAGDSVGSFCCRPAGGNDSAWAVTVPLRARNEV